MSNRSTTMRFAAALTAWSLLASCTTLHPDRLADATDVFPESEFKSGINAPSDSMTTSVFEASFEDVWRAATMGVTQAQLKVESAQKAKGVILATHVERFTNWRLTSGDFKRVYTYAVMVKELGPKSAEMRVMVRKQVSCPKATAFKMIIEALSIVFISWTFFDMSDNSKCDDVSQVHWTQEKIEQLNQVVTFTRNNLFAAGAM